MTLHFSREAEDDLIDIYRQSIDLFGITQAERYRLSLDHAFALIDRNPRLARLRSEFHPPARIHPSGAHVIIYTIGEEDQVLILRVRHGREDWGSDPASSE